MASVLFFSTSQNGGALANILNQCFNFNFLIENCNCLNTIKNTHLYSYSFLSLYFHCPGFPPVLGLTQIIHTWQWWEKTPNNLHPGLFSPFGNNVTAILHFLLPNDVLTLAEESLKWIFHFLLDHSSVDGISYFHIVDNPQINTFVYVAFPSIEFSSWDKLRTWVKNNKTGFLGGGAGGAWHICCQIDFQKSYTNKNTHQVCGVSQSFMRPLSAPEMSGGPVPYRGPTLSLFNSKLFSMKFAPAVTPPWTDLFGLVSHRYLRLSKNNIRLCSSCARMQEWTRTSTPTWSKKREMLKWCSTKTSV